MKVALISRSTIHTVKGGDTIQFTKTAEGLRKLGVTVRTFLASENIPYQEFDLLHFFNIIRPADILKHINRSGKPYVVSTIFLDYESYDKLGRRFPFNMFFGLLGKSKTEYVKNVYRYISQQDILVSNEYLLGHKRAIRKILKGTSLVLPNSVSEYNRIIRETALTPKYHIVPNGIDTSIFGAIPNDVERSRKVICVAQIYGLKNQHKLIKACGQLGYPLEIIGKPPPNHTYYYNYCKSIAGPEVYFTDFMTQQDLVRKYASAEIHALPSWFETTGLTSLEAAAMGCKLVVGKDGDTHDYFGEHAFYADPRDDQSIVNALKEAMISKHNDAFRERILNEYTWERASEETLVAYKKVLNNNG